MYLPGHPVFRPRIATIIPLLVGLISAVACGESAAPYRYIPINSPRAGDVPDSGSRPYHLPVQKETETGRYT